MTILTLRSVASHGLLISCFFAPLIVSAYPILSKTQTETQDIERLHEDAEQGNAQSQFALGTLYYQGREIEKDDAAAARWIRLAAEQNHPVAQYSLGLFYFEGWGVQRNVTEAVRWYRISSEQGYGEAQYSLGLAYENGTGVERNVTTAIQWFRLAAEQGHGVAQYYLGMKYDEGDGVERDLVSAHMWLSLAVEQSIGDEWEMFLGALDDVTERMTRAEIIESERLVTEWRPKQQP